MMNYIHFIIAGLLFGNTVNIQRAEANCCMVDGCGNTQQVDFTRNNSWKFVDAKGVVQPCTDATGKQVASCTSDTVPNTTGVKCTVPACKHDVVNHVCDASGSPF